MIKNWGVIKRQDGQDGQEKYDLLKYFFSKSLLRASTSCRGFASFSVSLVNSPSSVLLITYLSRWSLSSLITRGSAWKATAVWKQGFWLLLTANTLVRNILKLAKNNSRKDNRYIWIPFSKGMTGVWLRE